MFGWFWMFNHPTFLVGSRAKPTIFYIFSRFLWDGCDLKKELGRLLVDQRAYLRKKEKENKKRKNPAREKAESARRARIQVIDLRCLEIDALIQSTDKEVSRLENLIAENKQRLDTASKSVMDGVKVIARNAFYRALAPFRSVYDNYRDDHDYFRKLTQSNGLLVNRSGRLEVHLITPVAKAQNATTKRKVTRTGRNESHSRESVAMERSIKSGVRGD